MATRTAALAAVVALVLIAETTLAVAGALVVAQGPIVPTGPASPGPAIETVRAVAHPSASTRGFYVASTLVLYNNTQVSGNFRAGGVEGPSAVVFDSGQGNYYIASRNTGRVVVASGIDESYERSIGVGTAPSTVAYDSGQGEIFVANDQSANVTVISDASNSVVASIRVGGDPVGLTYAQGLGEIFVSNLYDGTVSVINDTSNSVIATISSFPCPWGSAYDPVLSEVFVADYCSGKVSVVSTLTNSIVTSIPQGGSGTYPLGVAFDPTLEEMFVADQEGGGTGVVAVIADASEAIVKNVSLGPDSQPQTVTYDPSGGTVLAGGITFIGVISDSSDAVVDEIPTHAEVQGIAYDSASEQLLAAVSSGNLTLINGSTDTVISTGSLGAAPQGLALDPRTNELYVAGSGPNAVGVLPLDADRLSGSIGPVSAPLALAYDSARGEVFATSEQAETLTAFNDSTGGRVATVDAPGPSCTVLVVVICSGPAAVAYDPAQGEIFAAVEIDRSLGGPFGIVEVVNDSNDSVLGSIAVGNGPDALAYDPVTEELFVANSGTHNVTVISTASDRVVGSVAVGFDPVAEAYSSVRSQVFVANEASDNVSVISDSPLAVVANVAVGDAPIAIASDDPEDAVLVADSGSSSVTVLSSSDATETEVVGVGSDPVGIACDPTTGEAFVSNHLQGTISFLLTRGTPYNTVTFQETGIPPVKLASDGWTVELNGATVRAKTSSVLFDELNGTYPVLITGPAGVPSARRAPTLTVTGPSLVPVAFHSGRTYTLKFAEKGLPLDQGWCLQLNGEPRCSTTSTFRFTNLTVGPYDYSVLSPLAGQTIGVSVGRGSSTGGPGLLNLNSGTKVALTFFHPYSVTFSEAGLPSGTWSVTIHGTTISAAAGDPIVFELANGTHPYRIGHEVGYRSSGSPHPARVAGGPLAVNVTFSVRPGLGPATETGVGVRPRDQ